MDRDERVDGIEKIRLQRIRNLSGILRDLPRESLPAARAQEIRRAALSTRYPVTFPLVRAAAALLLVAGLVTMAFLATRERYRPLELTVIDVPTNGAHDEDVAFEHIYGPDGDPAKYALVATERR